MRILTLDPGASCGAALFEAGELRAAWALTAEEGEPAPCGACPLCRTGACSHAARSAALVRSLLASVPELPRVDVCAVEVPAYWRTTPDMPALLTLAQTAGALIGAVQAAGVPLVLTFTPRSWKGTADKPAHQRETLAALTEAERGKLPRRPLSGRFQPDALDACGLGVWLLGRAGKWTCDPADFAELVEVPPARGGRKKASATTTAKDKAKRRAPAQGGLALFAHATGPGGTPAALHADDVDALLAGGVR